MSFVIENNILIGDVEPVDDAHKLGQLIYDGLSGNPDHVAQIDADTGEKTTSGEMKDRSVRCAVWMKKFGIGPDDMVVVVTHNHLDSYIPVIATFFVDAIFSAWHHEVALYSARRFMKKFTPKLIFTCETSADVLVEAAKLENLEVKFVVFGKHPEAQSLDEILESQASEEIEKFEVVNVKSPQDVAAVMLSSGTSGFPKGIMLSSGSLLGVLNKPNESPSVNLLWYSSLEWVSCTVLIVQAILTRNTRIVTGRMDAESFFQIVQKYKVLYAFIPPILINDVAKFDLAKNYDVGSLYACMFFGSKHSKAILKGLQQNIPTTSIYNDYGTTEIGIVARRTPESKSIESTGFVNDNSQIKFVDLISGKALGPNQKGQVYAKSGTRMIGYYKDPELTKQAFDEEGWFCTGDVGYYNEAGEIFIDDRITEILKYRDIQIAPVEIEELLLSHPGVQEAAVVGIPHELDGDWPAAFIKKTRGSRISEDDIVELTSVLEDDKKLRGGIHFIENLPRTSSGKVAKIELRQLAINLQNN